MFGTRIQIGGIARYKFKFVHSSSPNQFFFQKKKKSDQAKLEYKQIASKYLLQLNNLKLDEQMKLEGVTSMAEYEEKEYKVNFSWLIE